MSKKNKGFKPQLDTIQEPNEVSDILPSEEPVVSFHAQTLPAVPFPSYRVTIHSLNVRDIPSKSGRVIEQIVKDSEVTGRSFEEGEWVKVRTDSGAEGYCMREYLAEVTK